MITEEELVAACEARGTVTITGFTQLADGAAYANVDIDTTGFVRAAGGLPVRPVERLVIGFGSDYPTRPPEVGVGHVRWVGQPHVLQGVRLCVYLDPDVEWDPDVGVTGFIDRLDEWFADAIAAKFDPANAMYHAVGGVLHESPDAPTVVVDQPITGIGPVVATRYVSLRRRTDHCIDVVSWTRPKRTEPGLFPGVLVILQHPLAAGADTRLSVLLEQLRHRSGERFSLIVRALVDCANRLDCAVHLHLLLAVPNPARTGPDRHQIIGCRLPVERFRQYAEDLTAERLDVGLEVEWTPIDDTRESVTTRRDTGRTVAWYRRRSVEIWGCGALGSWIAEHLARAGAAHLTLRDPGRVTTGLLVRQNYREADVGRYKAEALADRIRNLGVTAEPVIEYASPRSVNTDRPPDLIIDTSVSVAVARELARSQSDGTLNAPVAQFSIDTTSSTFGIVTIAHGTGTTNTELDGLLREKVRQNPEFAAYSAFWSPDDPPSLVPSRGCSTPTFPGSAADAASATGTATNLIAQSLNTGTDAGYLFATAHSPRGAAPLVVVTP